MGERPALRREPISYEIHRRKGPNRGDAWSVSSYLRSPLSCPFLAFFCISHHMCCSFSSLKPLQLTKAHTRCRAGYTADRINTVFKTWESNEYVNTMRVHICTSYQCLTPNMIRQTHQRELDNLPIFSQRLDAYCSRILLIKTYRFCGIQISLY